MGKTAVIIGAGPAGLTAAYKMLKNNSEVHPVILEESDSIGGISKTINYKGNHIDIGGHRFFSKNEEVMKLWSEIMPVQGFPASDDILLKRDKSFPESSADPESEEDVILIRNRVSRILFLRRFFDYPISVKWQTFKNMGFARTMKAGCGFVYSAMFKRKEVSLEDFYINRFGKPLYEMFFEGYTEKVWGEHPSMIAPDWGSQRVKGLSLFKAVITAIISPFRKNKEVETSLIEQFIYPKKGPGQLWQKMADHIIEMGGEIRLNTKVCGINTEANQVVSLSVLSNDMRSDITGDYFLSSMAVKDLVEGMDSVPEAIHEVASALPYRDFMTVGLLLKKLKLNNSTSIKTVNNIVPDCWIYVQEKEVKLGRIQVFNNWSPYMVSNPEDVWVGLEYFCSEGDEMWNTSDQQFIDFAIDELVKIKVIDREDVKDSVRIKVKKAYPAYFGSYDHFDVIKEYLDTFDNLYCIGRNGQHRYNNMDHSMITGMIAAEAISGRMDKKAVWEVNQEDDYQEEKRS